VAASPSLSEDVRARFVARHRKQVTTEGELVISSQRYRDAPRNQADCLDKLRAWLAEAATPPKRRRATRPTLGSVARRRRDKQALARKKDYRRTASED
jgi:ribosome-associated protein